jgi:Cof subfamily protein (haloacid dehalogenase superfamily)
VGPAHRPPAATVSRNLLFRRERDDPLPDFRLIGIDLDGTLLLNSSDVSERNVAAIRAATARGVTVAIATGRPHVSAEQFVERLGLHDVPIISFNGALIKRPGEEKELFCEPVPADLAAEVVQYCVDRRMHLHYYLGDEMYVPRVSHWALLYQARAAIPPIPVGDLRRFNGRSPIKIIVCVPPEQAMDVLEEARERFGERLLVTHSMPEYVEFLSRDAGKGKALRWLAGHLGIPVEQTMGMGDMLNDLELVQMSGFGVAMPHAQEPVKAAAQYVAQSGPEGVAEAIEKFVLNA